jgi:hypothetical protein
MRISSKVSPRNSWSVFFKTLQRILVFKSFPVFLIAVTLAVLFTYVYTASQLSPETLRIPLANWAHRQGYFSAINHGGILKALASAPLKMMSMGGGKENPQIHIDIKFKHLQKIRKKRVVALEAGYLDSKPDDYVPASIRYEKKTIPVKLRLKGDLLDHLQGDKWSFRVHVRGGEHFWGLRRFSLQAPWARGFHSEVLFFETLRHLGLLAPRYSFLDVVINGDSIGLMAMEEHFSKELLEHNKRREGVIIKFDESLFWRNNQGPVFYNFRNVPIKAFRNSRIKKSSKLSSDYAVAVGLLRGFVSKELPASKVFDVEQMGRFLAVAELWGASHPIDFRNQRFYLNPISFKLEPIGFDASIPSRDVQLPTLSGDALIVENHPFAKEILKDPEIFEVFFKTLNGLADDLESGSLIDKLKKLESKVLPNLSKEFPLLSELPWQDLVQRAKIFSRLSKASYDSKKNIRDSNVNSYSSILHAYLENDEKGPYVEVANAIPEPIKVSSIEWFSKTGGEKEILVPTSKHGFPLTLAATPLNALPIPVKIYYAPHDLEKYSLHIFATIENNGESYESEAMPFSPPLSTHPIPESSLLEQLEQHPFLSYDIAKNKLEVKRGEWSVDETLVIPEDYSLTIHDNTTLRFSEKASLISRGSLQFNGTKDSPILLEGLHGKPWQGIAVLRAKNLSNWSFVNIKNTSGILQKKWVLTGGVTFYQSEAKLESCSFMGNQGEDALNIVGSKFDLNNVMIENTASDGFDADFSEGVITDGLFRNIGKLGGGDGVDVSGSRVLINGTVFQGISDKALSIGENSVVTANNIFIDDVTIGAASKDGSTLMISESTIKNTKFIGLIAYIKKAEYGPASIEAQNMNLEGAREKARAQKENLVVLDGKKIETEYMDVEQLYKTIMKSRLKK